MRGFLTFLEGLLSFLSPCMLPMLPLYISYFAGEADQKKRTLLNAVFFVAGFTVLFSLLGFFSGTVGAIFVRHARIVNLVCGALVVLFGLSYLEWIRLPFFRGMKPGPKADAPARAFVFGLIYSVSLTPCVGAFLGSALMLASVSGSAWRGLVLLIWYSLGLGVPFLLSAVLIDWLAKAFALIKRYYRVINLVCGLFLVVMGLVMMCGGLNRILTLLAA